MLRRRTFLGSTLGMTAASMLPKAAFAKAKSPHKIYDTHAHFYSADFAKYPVDGSTARYGREEVMARIKANPQTPEVMFKAWDANGIVKGCGVQYGSAYSNDNRYVLDIAKQYPKRIIPVVILDPVAADTPATLARMAREDKISGVRFRGVPDQKDGTHSFLTAPSAPVWEAANQLGLVIVLMPHSRKIPDRAGVMKQVGDLAAKYPNVTIVLDHMGFPNPVPDPNFGFFPEHLALAQHKNVYFKHTTLLMEQLDGGKVPHGPFLEYANRKFGSDHIIWGSDMGNSKGTMEEFVHMLLESAKGLSPADQKAIFYDTAERIFVPGGRGPA